MAAEVRLQSGSLRTVDRRNSDGVLSTDVVTETLLLPTICSKRGENINENRVRRPTSNRPKTGPKRGCRNTLEAK